MGRGRRSGGRDRGAAAVEFALVLPLLLLLVFGIIDFGRMASIQEQLTQAARAAAQAELVGGDPDRAAQDVFTHGSVKVSVLHQCGANPSRNDTAQVKVDYDFEFVTPLDVLTGVTGHPTLSATGTVLCRG